MIGDPSGKSKERNLQNKETLAANTASIKSQLERFLDLSDPEKGIIVNNYDWLGHMETLDFLRDYGKYFSINYMTADKNCLLTGAYTLDTNPLTFGDWKITFNLSDVTMSDSITIVDPEASGKKKYYEVNDSTKLIEKLYNVYKGKNVGITIDAALTNGTANEVLSGGANVDFSAKSFMHLVKLLPPH